MCMHGCVRQTKTVSGPAQDDRAAMDGLRRDPAGLWETI